MAPGLVSEQRERAKLSTAFEVREDFASDALLILECMFMGKLRAEFEEGLLRVGSFAMNETDEAGELVPGLAMRAAIFAGVNGGELPLIFSRKGLDGLGQVSGEGFQFIGRTLRCTGLPEIGTQIEIFHTEAIALTDRGFEVFGPGQIMELGQMTGEFGFVFAG